MNIRKKYKIVWTTNILLPDIANHYNLSVSQSGTWLNELLKNIVDNYSEIFEFYVVHNTRIVKKITQVKINNINYVLFGNSRTDAYLNLFKNRLNTLESIILDINPDLIHIHGTEEFYGLITKSIQHKVIVSLQGIRQIIFKNYFSDISKKKYFAIAFKNLDIILFLNYISFKFLMKIEKKILLNNTYFLGRTIFDESAIKGINKEAQYFEGFHDILRPAFYRSKWEIKNTKPYKIHATISERPFKGIMLAIKAVDILKYKYPNIELGIAGNLNGSLGKYFKNIIKKKGLNKNICFLGQCDENEIIQSLLSARVYIHCSYIENSPLSLIEAGTIGMPLLSAYVGGIPSFIKDEENGLFYPKGNEYYLAFRIASIIENKELAIKLGNNAYTTFREKNKIENIVSKYKNIYEKIINLNKE